MLNLHNVSQLLEETTTDVSVTLTDGGTVVDTMVDGFTGMTTGFLDAIKTGFDKLVLNSSGNGLSILAIWTIVFFGIGMAPKAIRWIVGLFQAYKASRAN